MDQPQLTVDAITHKLIVTIPGATYCFSNRTEMYEVFPELRPAPPTPAEERAVSRAQRQSRAAVNQWGHSRSGRR